MGLQAAAVIDLVGSIGVVASLSVHLEGAMSIKTVLTCGIALVRRSWR